MGFLAQSQFGLCAEDASAISLNLAGSVPHTLTKLALIGLLVSVRSRVLGCLQWGLCMPSSHLAHI